MAEWRREASTAVAKRWGAADTQERLHTVSWKQAVGLAQRVGA